MQRVRPQTVRIMGTDVPPGLLWTAVLAGCVLITSLTWALVDRPAALWALAHRDLQPWSTLRGALGPLTLVPVLLIGVPSALALRQGRRVAWSVLLVLLAALAMSNFAGFVLKRAVLRPRPAAVHARASNTGEESVDAEVGGNPRHSFPSGDALVDTAITVALWGLLGWRRRWGWLLLVPLVVGAQRFVAGAHFPSDIIAGWVVGAMLGVEVARSPQARDIEEGSPVDSA